MSKSTELVKYIGLHTSSKVPSPLLKNERFYDFLHLAEQNKIPLLFLKTVPCNSVTHPFLEYYEERYENTLKLAAFTAGLLDRKKIKYALFKTLKPFPYVPSDIDILLSSDGDLSTAIIALKHQGCVPLDKDNYGLTLFSPKHKMSIDLTTQIAVSGLVYINKKPFFDHLHSVAMDETLVQVPVPALELLVNSAHSVYKEQTYTLSDFYTHLLLKQHWNEASRLAESFHLKQAFNHTLRLTKQIAAYSRGSLDVKEKKYVGTETTSVKGNRDEDIELPRKYKLSFLIATLIKKITEDSATRSSFPLFARSVSNLSFYKRILEHATRETY